MSDEGLAVRDEVLDVGRECIMVVSPES